MSTPCPKCGGAGCIPTGPELKATRLAAELTQEALIAMEPRRRGRSRLTPSFLSQVEHGGRPPSPRIIALYARVK